MVMLTVFQHGNLKDCLMKVLSLMLHQLLAMQTKMIINYVGNKTRVEFDGSCLKEDKITFTHGNIVNIYVFYEIILWNRGYDDYPMLENSLFGAAKLTKNADIDKYKYSGYDIGFDGHGIFSVLGGGIGKNVTIFGADMSFSVHVDNKKKNILILGKGPTQGLDDTNLTAEKCIQSI